MRTADGDQDTFFTNGTYAETMDHGDGREVVFLFDGGGDGMHGFESEGDVGGVGELFDGFGGEGVAGCTWIADGG